MEPASPAFQAGLRPGMKIVGVGRHARAVARRIRGRRPTASTPSADCPCSCSRPRADAPVWSAAPCPSLPARSEAARGSEPEAVGTSLTHSPELSRVAESRRSTRPGHARIATCHGHA